MQLLFSPERTPYDHYLTRYLDERFLHEQNFALTRTVNHEQRASVIYQQETAADFNYKAVPQVSTILDC